MILEYLGKHSYIVGKIFLALLISGIFVILYLNPTKETMVCDKNYKCNIEHEFANLVKTKNELNLNPQSIMYLQLKNPYVISFRRITIFPGHYYYKVEFDNKLPFITEYASFKHFNKDAEYNKFYEYRNNPEKGYTTESEAHPIRTYMFLIAYLFAISPFFLNNKKRIQH